MSHVETTISPGNLSSEASFRAFANIFDAPMEPSPKYDSLAHFSGNHASELLWRIGPLHFKE